MAQQLRNITLGAPGFKGVNTQDSPIGLDPQFAQVCNNAVIDRFGRLGSRKGFVAETSASELTKLGGNPIVRISQWQRPGATNLFVCAGNNKLFVAQDLDGDPNGVRETLTELTLPSAYTITGNDWMMVDFNGKMYFYQDGHDPLVLDTTSFATTSVERVATRSTDTVTLTTQHSVAIGAYGRMWRGGGSADSSTLYWSDTLIGENFSIDAADQPSFAGRIILTEVWPDGYDEITGLSAHNGKLIIFGVNNVLVYTGAEDPTTMVLEDSFSGIGCVDKDSVMSLGTDIAYLSETGVRIMSRTIQGQGNMPNNDVSNNIRKDLLQEYVTSEAAGGDITSVYSPEEALYLLIFGNTGNVYAFDTRSIMEDGTYRVTIWLASPFKCGHHCAGGNLWVGGTFGLGKYEGYSDGGDSYSYEYESPVLTFGQNANLKFIKSVRPTVIGGNGQIMTIGWGYGYEGDYESEVVSVGAGVLAEYGEAEYGEAEYSGGTGVTDEKINANGSGRNVRLRISADINGEALSLQEINVQALLGRIL